MTAAEIAAAALPGLPATERGIQKLAAREGWAAARNARYEPLARARQGRGGGMEFHITLLPAAARALLQPQTALSAPPTREDQWAAFDRLPDTKKDEAKRRAAILARVEELALTGGRTAAVLSVVAEQAASGEKVSPATIYAWFKLVEGLDKADRLPALAPRHQGGQVRIALHEDLFNRFKEVWLRPEQPSDVSCWRETAKLAAARKLEMPPLAIFKRRLRATVNAEVILMARGGRQAVKNAYPAQIRDRSGLHALEGLVCDSHTWDVNVVWPDGSMGRPVTTAGQDLYSNRMLGWRHARTPSSDLILLMLGDVFAQFGIPDIAVFDNGRDFASKAITGGVPNRYRWRHDPQDPVGVLTALTVKVHFTMPYSGQSKPIERAFRDWATDIAKHPAFAGAYTGNAPHNKPSNYGSRAVPYEDFVRVVDAEIRAWNEREGRRSPIAQGRSYDAVFRESYAQQPIRKATPEQLRMCLLKSLPVTPNRRDGSIRILGNVYWTDGMASLIGQRVVARFDGQNLWQPVYLYGTDGRFLFAADCTEPAGFFDVDSGRRFARARAAVAKAISEQAKAQGVIDAERQARIAMEFVPEPEAPTPASESRVVRGVFGLRGAAAIALNEMSDDALGDVDPSTLSFNDRLRLAERKGQLRLVSNE